MPEGARVLDTAPITYCAAKSAKAGELRHSLALVLLVIAAIWLMAAGRWIATDTIVPWDAKNQFYRSAHSISSSTRTWLRAVSPSACWAGAPAGRQRLRSSQR
jgi:hypothetical protein